MSDRHHIALAAARQADHDPAFRYVHVGQFDQWQAEARTAADNVGINLADPDEADVLVCGLLVAHQINAAMFQTVPAWTDTRANSARIPLLVATSAVRPYIESPR